MVFERHDDNQTGSRKYGDSLSLNLGAYISYGT